MLRLAAWPQGRGVWFIHVIGKHLPAAVDITSNPSTVCQAVASNKPLTLSPSHPLTLSPSHPLTPSPSHPLDGDDRNGDDGYDQRATVRSRNLCSIRSFSLLHRKVPNLHEYKASKIASSMASLYSNAHSIYHYG